MPEHLGTRQLFQQTGDRHQQTVAGIVTMDVVDQAELIDIHPEQDADYHPPAPAWPAPAPGRHETAAD